MNSNEVQKTKLAAIQQENPAMNAVTIITEQTENGEKQYFNIVDLQGNGHKFFNNENIDVLKIYDDLKAKSKKQITPNQLIGAINRKIHEVKMAAINNANNEVNIASAPKVEEVVKETPIVMEKKANEIPVVEQKQVSIPVVEPKYVTSKVEEQKPVEVISDAPTINNETKNTKVENKVNNDLSKLIPIKEFYRILDSGENMDDNTRMSVNLWYAYFGELIIYEDFLNMELKKVLNAFRNYVIALKISDNMTLNANQIEACDKLYNLEEIKRGYSIGNEFNNVAEKDKGMVYTKNMPLQDNAAFVAYVQIFAIVFSIATILSALVIYVVSK